MTVPMPIIVSGCRQAAADKTAGRLAPAALPRPRASMADGDPAMGTKPKTASSGEFSALWCYIQERLQQQPVVALPGGLHDVQPQQSLAAAAPGAYLSSLEEIACSPRRGASNARV